MRVMIKNVGKDRRKLSDLKGERVAFEPGEEKAVDLHDAVVLDVERSYKGSLEITAVDEGAANGTAGKIVLSRRGVQKRKISDVTRNVHLEDKPPKPAKAE
jgi:hypothetical protein